MSVQTVVHNISAQYKSLGKPIKLFSFVHGYLSPPQRVPTVEKPVEKPAPTPIVTSAAPVAEDVQSAQTRSGRQLVWLITGTSTGFGRRLAKAAILRGDLVIATVRSLQSSDRPDVDIPPSLAQNLRTIELDVTEGEKSLKAKIDEAALVWGRIDVLVNNAGQGLVGLSEEGGSALFRRTFDVNVFGVIDMTTVTLPYLRASKGCVINIGSRSAWKTEINGVGPYSASKAAVHAYTETLATELAPFGVRVMLVAPGAFRTEGIHAKPFYMDRPIDVYDEVRNVFAKRFMSITGTQKGDPVKAMEALVDIVRQEGFAKDRPWPTHLFLGEDSIRDIRAKSAKILNEVDQWEDVAKAVAF